MVPASGGLPPDPLVPMQRAAAALWSPGSFWHAGGLAWRGRDVRLDRAGIALVGSESEVTGWGWIERGSHLNALVAARDDDSAQVLSRWFVHDAEPGPLTADVPSGARVLGAALAQLGFVEAPDAPFSVDLRCSPAGLIGPPALPDGYLVRPLATGEQQALVAAHCAAWNPHLLPWPQGSRPDLPPDAASSFSACDLALLEATWPYRRELVTVVEAPDGSLAGSCIAWLDDRLAVAEIEPLGVVPAHRGLGLGRALCAGAAAAVAACGGTELRIHPRGDAAYPAARRLYESCGFRAVGRTVPYFRADG